MLRWKSLFASRLAKGQRRGRRNSAAPGRRLLGEHLEDRRMLAVMTVTDLGDDTLANLAGDGLLSLREAVEAINTGAAVDGIGPTSGAFGTDDEIVFDPALFTGGTQTITLVDGEFELTEPVIITGPGATQLTIDANLASRVFNFTPGTGDVTLTGMTLTRGRTTGANENGGAVRSGSTGVLNITGLVVSNSGTTGADSDGGGVYSNGTLNITDSTITGNSTTQDDSSGGGAYGRYDVTILRSTISGNSTAGNESRGGGAYSFIDSVAVTDSTVSGNSTAGTDSSGGGIYANDNAVITNSTISGNSTAGSDSEGGGVYTSTGTVTVTGSMITGNSTTGPESAGGGIYAFTNASLTNSTVSGNRTQGIGSEGGGVYTSSGNVTVTGTAITGNSTAGTSAEGGGIYSFGNVSLTNSTVSGNSTTGADSEGGGVYARITITMLNSTVRENFTEGASSDGGGLFALGNVSITNSTISGNRTTTSDADGGGIYVDGSATVNYSTISGNSTQGDSADGGGLYARGNVTLFNSTISGNFTQGASADGGGVFALEGLFVDMSTITLNRAEAANAFGGGLWNDEDVAEIRNSIVAANTAGGGSPDLRPGAGTLTVEFSIIGDNAGTGLAESQTPNLVTGNIIGSAAGAGVIDPRLAPLANNGGPTETHRLLPNSPALNQGDPAFIGFSNDFDQRGPDFFRERLGRVDIGAFEAQVLLDANAEIGTWAAGTVLVDINGDFIFNPTNPVLTDRDLAYRIGFASDYIFAGNFAGPGPDLMFGTADDTTMLMGNAVADGFDKVAAYGRDSNGNYRWLFDINGNGTPDFSVVDPNRINGFPVAGNFDGNFGNGDEVGIFTGTTWWFDTNHDFLVDTSFSTDYAGFPIAGDFDGDGDTDVGTYVAGIGGNFFTIDLNTAAAAGDIFLDGAADFTFRMGSPLGQEIGFGGTRERPIAADFNEDGIDDIGLWVPDGINPVPNELAEWFILVTGDDPFTTEVEVTLLDRIETDQIIDFIPFSPAPFGNDLYIQFGNTFALPIAGNFVNFTLPEPPPPDEPVIPIVESPGLTTPDEQTGEQQQTIAAITASPAGKSATKALKADKQSGDSFTAVATITAAPAPVESSTKIASQSAEQPSEAPVTTEKPRAEKPAKPSKPTVEAPVIAPPPVVEAPITVTVLAVVAAVELPIIEPVAEPQVIAPRIESTPASTQTAEAKKADKAEQKQLTRSRALVFGNSSVATKVATVIAPTIVTLSPVVVTTTVDTVEATQHLAEQKLAAVDAALAEITTAPAATKAPEIVPEAAIIQAAAWQEVAAQKQAAATLRRARKLSYK